MGGSVSQEGGEGSVLEEDHDARWSVREWAGRGQPVASQQSYSCQKEVIRCKILMAMQDHHSPIPKFVYSDRLNYKHFKIN